MNVSFVTITSIGPAHIEQMLVNQDAVKCNKRNGFWVVAVADGMGSRKLSHIGSQFAVKIATDVCISSSFAIPNKDIVTLIYSDWLSALKKAEVSPKDAVTTLLFTWGNKNGQFRYFQLGDGEIVSNLRKFTAKDSDDFSNETTGLGLSKTLSDWSIGSSTFYDNEKGLTLMTDGISEDIDDHTGFCASIINSSKSKSSRALKKKLTQLLDKWPTPHHTDDKTIAVVMLNE